MSNDPRDDDFDYFCLQSPILERLRTVLPDLPIESAASMAGIFTDQMFTPCAYVVPGNSNLLDERNPSAALEEQLWHVVIASRVPGEIKSDAAARSEAGPLVNQVVKALRGWTPFPETHDVLRRTKGTQVDFLADGTLLVNLTFRTEFVF